jgi:hypothetical protein
MNRSLRIVAVTLGLLAAGAVAGALAAVAALAIGLWLSGQAVGTTHNDGDMLAIVGTLGALFGGVLLPATAWLFLRRVPLGLAVLSTLLGTIVGSVLGWVVPLGHDHLQRGLIGAFAGFAAAALLLRIRASAPRVRVPAPTRG